MAEELTKINDGWAKKVAEGSYQDKDQKSLWLYVTKTSRTWGYYRWMPKTGPNLKAQPIRISLGPIADMGVEAARDLAAEYNVSVRKGIHPTRPNARADRSSITLKEIVQSYTLKLRGEKRRHPEWMERCIELSFGDWLNQPFGHITKGDIFDRHKIIAADPKRGKMAAARAVHAMRALFRYAAEADLFSGKNEAKDVRVAPQKVRRRTLSPGELAKVMESLDRKDHSEWVKPYFRLLMLTGARRHNVASMSWKDIDLKHAEWRIKEENAKGGEPITIPLVPEAVEILEARKGLSKDWVFPSKKASCGHLVEPHFAWKRVLELAEVSTDITIHDIRRSFGAMLNERNVPLSVIAKAMGHKNSATTARHYTPTSDAAVRDALNRVFT